MYIWQVLLRYSECCCPWGGKNWMVWTANKCLLLPSLLKSVSNGLASNCLLCDGGPQVLVLKQILLIIFYVRNCEHFLIQYLNLFCEFLVWFVKWLLNGWIIWVVGLSLFGTLREWVRLFERAQFGPKFATFFIFSLNIFCLYVLYATCNPDHSC